VFSAIFWPLRRDLVVVYSRSHLNSICLLFSMEASIQFIIESPQYTPSASKRTRLVTSCDSWSVYLSLVFDSCSLGTAVWKRSSVPNPQTISVSSPPRTQGARHARPPRSPVVSRTGKNTLLSAVVRSRDAPASTEGKRWAAALLPSGLSS